ncbi:hypothetical protein [Nocardiopsis sp. ATB16-24]|uniref:hypothetical protein n=1 Tax=Nocardiopsis sp. ATB16-24 TaxID=3019555 RepID=UPI0025576CF4|nr:hypothetical protein [Nocardiopsis sp. ATB16-24]
MSSSSWRRGPVRAGPILGATVIVADPESARTEIAPALGWPSPEEGPPLSVAEAERWGTPTLAGAPTRILRPSSGEGGWIRVLAGGSGTPVPPPLATVGWRALELMVRDAEAAVERAKEQGFRVLGRPRRLGNDGSLPLTAGQVMSRDGVILYLTQVLKPIDGFSLPRLQGDVDGIFIAVLGARDLVATRAFLEERIRLFRASDRSSPVGVVNEVLGLAKDTAHRLSSLQLEGSHLVEVDQVPHLGSAPPPPGGPPSRGVAVVAMEADVRHAHTLRTPEGALVDLIPRVTSEYHP